MQQAESGHHPDAAEQDQQKTNPMEQSPGPSNLFFDRSELRVGGEHHPAQPHEKKHDSNEMKRLDREIIHGE